MDAIVFRSEDGDYTKGFPTRAEMLAHLETNTQIAVCVIDGVAVFGMYEDAAYYTRAGTLSGDHHMVLSLYLVFCGYMGIPCEYAPQSYAIFKADFTPSGFASHQLGVAEASSACVSSNAW